MQLVYFASLIVAMPLSKHLKFDLILKFNGYLKFKQLQGFLRWKQA